MRKFLFLIIMSAGSFAVCAQPTASDFKPAHKIEMGIGAIEPDAPVSSFYYSNYTNTTPYYFSQAVVSGAINARYRYQPMRWLELGATVSYGSYEQRYKDRVTDVNVGGHYVSTVNILLSARFNYYSTPTVRLYGSASMGYGMNFAQGSLYSESNSMYEGCFAGQITPFGIEIGRKLYGFAEIPAYGSLGFVIAGIGVKF